VRLGAVKPRLLFALRPLHYIAFVPSHATGSPLAASTATPPGSVIAAGRAVVVGGLRF
jgi:hypothetical protein